MSGANSHDLGITRAAVSNRTAHGARTWRVLVTICQFGLVAYRSLDALSRHAGVQVGMRPSRERYEPGHRGERCLSAKAPQVSKHLSDGPLGQVC